MPIKTIAHRLETCARQGRRCDAPGCHRDRYRISRFCKLHDSRVLLTGHPLGETITLKQIRPWIREAKKYLRRNQDHPDIANAIRWIERLVYQGGDRTLPAINRDSKPEIRLMWWLCRLKRSEVDPLDCLALVVAVFAHRLYYPSAFKDDRHFAAMLAIRFLRQVKSDRYFSPRKGERSFRHRITVGTRDLLSAPLLSSVGPVSNAVAKLLVDKVEAMNPARHLQLLLQ